MRAEFGGVPRRGAIARLPVKGGATVVSVGIAVSRESKTPLVATIPSLLTASRTCEAFCYKASEHISFSTACDRWLTRRAPRQGTERRRVTV